VSVHPPLSQMRIGATLFTIRTRFCFPGIFGARSGHCTIVGGTDMNRRRLLKIIPLAASAPALRLPAAAGKARFRPAICAYSYREELRKKAMTYEDLVRRAVEYGLDGLDLTVYWFPSTSDDFLLPLRRLAYLSGVAIYAISIRTDMCRPPGPDREREIADVKKWIDVAQKLGASHIRVFGGDVPDGATEDQAAA